MTGFQDDAGLRSPTLGGPHLKQTVLTSSSDRGASWAPATVLTGYLQQPASLVRSADGVLLCIFSHGDGWPRNASGADGWTAKHGQRFVASLDEGATWTNTVFELHRGGTDASSVVLPNGTVVTAYAMRRRPDGPAALETLHWAPPSRAELGVGGVFAPPAPGFAAAVGRPPMQVSFTGIDHFLVAAGPCFVWVTIPVRGLK